MKIYLLKVVKFYKPLCGEGQVCASHHTNVCKISILCGAISSHAKKNKRRTTFKFGNFINFQGALFSGVDGFSLTRPYKT